MKYLLGKNEMSVKKIQRPELFFTLVAPVGVDLDMIIEVLSTELKRQNYDSSLHNYFNNARRAF